MPARPRALVDFPTEQGDQVWWNAEETNVYSTGKSTAIETHGSLWTLLFGWRATATHNNHMENKQLHPYVPFCRLPLAVGFLLLPAYTAAAYDLLRWAPNEAELVKAFREIWDRERLVPADIGDLLSSGQLKALLLEYAERQSYHMCDA